MVGWDRICKPKTHGGLGFKKLDVMNQALLRKLTWEVVSNSDKLWVKVFCSKYGLDLGKLPLTLPEKQRVSDMDGCQENVGRHHAWSLLVNL